MNYIEKILSEISRVKRIVENWKISGEISEIERKIVKDYLSRIYDKLSAAELVPEKQIITTEKKEEEKPAKTVEEKTTNDKITVKQEPESKPEPEPKNKIPQPQVTPSVLGETLQQKKRFLSDDFAENDVLLTPIKDLSKGIGLNDKFLFAKELFGGNAQQFGKTITTINDMNSIEDALEYVKNNFSWQENNPVVKHFITLVRRRFM
ncbi:MAG: hypothetical protein LBQ28_10855 [Prevotellaceae bacterium]|jgi:hypothetical protein|nr:hypothetical protein [Prevotellaceae bacterium]